MKEPLHSSNDSSTNGHGALPPAPGRALNRYSSSNGHLSPSGAYPSGVYPPVPGDDEDTVDLSRYWRALKRRWPLVLKTFGVVLALGALFTALQKPIYQSTATILVTTPGGAGIGAGGGGALLAGLLGASAPSNSLGQQLVIIKSPGVAGRAVARLEGSEQAQIKAFNKLDIFPEPGADAINVQVQARDAKAAGDYANAICDEFRAQSDQQNQNQVDDATRQVKDQRDRARRALVLASLRRKEFQQNNGTVDIDQETKLLLSQIDSTQSAIRAADADQLSAQASLRGVEEQLRQLPNYTPASITSTPEVQTLRAQLVKLQIDRVEKRRQFTERSRVISDIDKQIAALQRQLNASVKTQVAGLSPNPLRQSLLQRQADTQNQILIAQSRAADLRATLAPLQAQRAQLPGRANDLAELKLDEDTALDAYKSWDEKYRTLAAQAQSRNATSRTITPGALGAQIAPRKGFNMLASALLGLLLGVVLALVVDRLDDRVHASEDAEEAVALPILGRIPRLNSSSALALLSQAQAPTPSELALVEAFRLLRANIAFAGLDEPPRVLAVTSGRAGEGKTTVAFHLARVLAASGAPTLLVDVDLRRPGVHTLADLPNGIGLSNVLSGEAALSSALQRTTTPNLQVLSSGPENAFSVELLDSPQGRAALASLSNAAQFVIFDCPPTLGLADAHIVASLADATLLVVECEATTKRDIARTARSLSQTGAHLLGLVLNKAPLAHGDNDLYFQLPPSDGTTSALSSRSNDDGSNDASTFRLSTGRGGKT